MEKTDASQTISNLSSDIIPANIKVIKAHHKWELGYTGNGVIIAILDTGCDQHPDLIERIVGGYNFTDDNHNDSTKYNDENGHGTHVAGIIAGSLNQQGIVGVAPGAKLLILKVLNREGVGGIDSLIGAINYAVHWRGANGERVDVLSVSLGLRHSSDALYKAILNAIGHNIVVVAASGNQGDGDSLTNEYSYPGAYEEVIQVGAVDGLNQVTDFSNTNECIDIYAPGVNVLSTGLTGNLMERTGTSMATPHVSGALAILIEEFQATYNRRPNPDELHAYLMEHTFKKISDSGKKLSILDLSVQNKRGK